MTDRYAVQEAYESVVLHPPEEVKAELERRGKWLREVWKVSSCTGRCWEMEHAADLDTALQDGETLRDWDKERKKREKDEARKGGT